VSEDNKRRADTWLAVIRSFSRLWGFLAFLVFTIWLFRQIVLPFVLAAFLAYLLAPTVARLQPRLGRGGAVILIYAFVLAVLGAFVGILLPALFHDLARLRDAAPTILARVHDDWLPRASEWLEQYFGTFASPPEPISATQLRIIEDGSGERLVDLSGLRLQITESANGGWIVESANSSEKAGLNELIRNALVYRGQEFTGVIGEFARTTIFGVGSFLTKFMLTFMIAAFMLIDLSRVNRFIRSLIPLAFRPAFDEIVRGIDEGMAGVIRGQLLICLVNGVLTYIGLLVVGVKYSLLLGLLASIFSLVPIFGTITSSVPIILIALLSAEQGVAMGKALAMFAWICGIHLIEANFLNPKIIGSAAHIHPVIVVFALLAGEHVFGLVGALFAVPVASMIQTIFLYARRNAAAFAQAEGTATAMQRSSLDLERSNAAQSGVHEKS
jgi:predicted PurR-regulated permease PerM